METALSILTLCIAGFVLVRNIKIGRELDKEIKKYKRR